MTKSRLAAYIAATVSLVLSVYALVGGMASSGSTSRLLVGLSGGLAALFGVAALVFGYTFVLRSQSERIARLRPGTRVHFLSDDTALTALRDAGIAPRWTLRFPVMCLTPSHLEFWTGVREPFIFGRIARENVVAAAPHGTSLRLVIDTGSTHTTVLLVPRVVRGQFVFRADGAFLRRIASEITSQEAQCVD